jgi:multidrug efflux system membrane fusion protein
MRVVVCVVCHSGRPQSNTLWDAQKAGGRRHFPSRAIFRRLRGPHGWIRRTLVFGAETRNVMNGTLHESETGVAGQENLRKPRIARRIRLTAAALAVVAGLAWASRSFAIRTDTDAAPTPALPSITASPPLQRDVAAELQFLGQFSGVEELELRAQVGGTLTEIGFKDGDVVKKGDLLFVIDPEPYEIKLSHALSELEIARARAELASRKLKRAETLRPSGGISAEEVDERAAEQRSKRAAVGQAEAMVRDARFDLGHCRITAPFAGRIGRHLVSIGNLVAGSRAASSPTTLLATLVSLDPLYLYFDMSEADYMAFLRGRRKQHRSLSGSVGISLSDETEFSRKGTLDFLDNALNRSSGTIRARATVANRDLLLTPGGFARVRLALSRPGPALLVPDAAVLPDQSQHVVLTVGTDDTITAKVVELGDLHGKLRVIRSGLAPTDRVVIDGMPIVRPGSKVSASSGSIRLDSEQE